MYGRRSFSPSKTFEYPDYDSEVHCQFCQRNAKLSASGAVDEYGCNCKNQKRRALNSAVECHLHTVEVIGSNPIAPTTPEMPEGISTIVEISGVEIYKFLLASGHVRGNITESSVAARSGATFRAKRSFENSADITKIFRNLAD